MSTVELLVYNFERASIEGDFGASDVDDLLSALAPRSIRLSPNAQRDEVRPALLDAATKVLQLEPNDPWAKLVRDHCKEGVIYFVHKTAKTIQPLEGRDLPFDLGSFSIVLIHSLANPKKRARENDLAESEKAEGGGPSNKKAKVDLLPDPSVPAFGSAFSINPIPSFGTSLPSSWATTLPGFSWPPLTQTPAVVVDSEPPVIPVTTTEVKCLGGCGFFGGMSGFCSKCWNPLPRAEKVRHTEEQKVLQVQREKDREVRLAKEEEERKIADKEASEKREQAQKELEEKMGKGECYKVDLPFDDASAESWGNGVISLGGRLERWTCGLVSPKCPVNHTDHKKENWEPLYDIVTKLSKTLSIISEGSDFDGTWQACYIASDLLKAQGVTDDDSTDVAIFKALSWDQEARQHCTVTPINATRKVYWDNSYYFDTRVNSAKLAKLKAATNVIKKECDNKSIISLTFSDEMVVYPQMVAGKTKKGGNIIICFANRVDT